MRGWIWAYAPGSRRTGKNAEKREGHEDPRDDHDVAGDMEAEGVGPLRGNAQNYKELNTYNHSIKMNMEERIEWYRSGLSERLPEALGKPRIPEEDKKWEYPPKPPSVPSEMDEEKIHLISDIEGVKLASEARGLEPPVGIMEEVEEWGTDALGWYEPFHFNRRWGIFIRVEGIKFLLDFFKRNSNASQDKLFRASIGMIYYHEYFHFLTEVTSTFLEYDYLDDIEHRILKEDVEVCVEPLYKKFASLVMKEDINPAFEEGLANSYSLGKLKWPGKIHARNFIEGCQPSFYRGLSLDDKSRSLQIRELGRWLDFPDMTYRVLIALFEKIEKLYECLLLAEFHRPAEQTPQIPSFLVFERPIEPLVFKFCAVISDVRIASYIGDKEHHPPHIHVNGRRYWWPSLKPYKHDEKISSKEVRAIAEKSSEIDRNIEKSIKWSRRYPSLEELKEKHGWPDDHPPHPDLHYKGPFH